MFDINPMVLSFPSNNHDEDRLTIKEFPFVSYFSLAPIIEKWNNLNKEQNLVYGSLWEGLEKWLDEVPELLEPTLDYERLQKHKDIIKLLLSPIFANEGWSLEYKAIAPPFRHLYFQTTDEFARKFQVSDAYIHELERKILWQSTFNAYRSIFREYYRYELKIEIPIILELPDAETGMEQYFKVSSSDQYYSIQAVKPLPDLSPKDFKYLVSNYRNLSIWMDYLPPDYFIFSGFSLLNFHDVTQEIVADKLKNLLLDDDSEVVENNFGEIQKNIRVLLNNTQVNLGIASVQANGELNFREKKKIWNSLKVKEISEITHDNLSDSIYQQVLEEEVTVIHENLEEYATHAPIEMMLKNMGVKSVFLCPLHYQEKLVGLLELTSDSVGVLKAQSNILVHQIAPIFGQAIHQHLKAFEYQIEATTKQYFTAIHPTVSWRFREEAMNILERKDESQNGSLEPIVFHDVYPLYSKADIRHSSMAKTAAIQEDMVEQLMLAKEVLSKATPTTSLVLLDEIQYKLGKTITLIDKGLNPGEEVAIFDFLRLELHPLFGHLQQAHPSLRDMLHHYWEYTDPDTGILSRKQRAYEQSLDSVNTAISQYLDKQAAEAQKVYPHYYEKYLTDGVEHNIYVGASLVNKQDFDMVYLKNLRLKQLLSCCEIVRLLTRLKSDLSINMDIAQFILVHSQPITIKFKMSEKMFGVDGNINLRYDMIKSRINKAIVKDSREKLAQANKISIVYSQEEEAREYLRYVEYLQERKYLLSDIEQLELEPIQGIKDLYAIRVQVST